MMDERFTDRARKVMQLANQEAQRFNHEYIGTEHILLGLVKEGTGVDKGDLFGFGYELKGDILTISDWKGTGGAGFGFVLQGEYKKSDSK